MSTETPGEGALSLGADGSPEMSPLVLLNIPASVPLWSFPQGALAQAVSFRGEHGHPLLSTQPT